MNQVLAFGVLGMFAGMLYLGSLRWLSIRLVEARPGGRGWWHIAALQVLRIVLMAGVCIWAVHQGAAALLALAIGLGISRAFCIAIVRRGLRSTS